MIVLGMGLISLAKFQGTVMKDNSLGKGRTVAAHLAQQKLEDLRNFTTLRTPDPQTNPPTLSFQAIDDNAGGEVNGSGMILGSGDVDPDNSNVRYNRSWTVIDYCYDTVNAGASLGTADAPCPRPFTGIPDFKLVTVTVSWTDESQGPQSLNMSTIIAANEQER